MIDHADWEFILVSRTGEHLTDLPNAYDRALTVNLDEPSEASFSMSGYDPDIAYIAELAVDLCVFRNARCLYRGRVAPTDDQISADDHTGKIASYDYRWVLEHNELYQADMNVVSPDGIPERQYLGIDQSALAWDVVNLIRVRPNSNLAQVTRGLGQTTGRIRDRHYLAGAKVGELVANLGRVIDGFNWSIEPDDTGALKFNVYHPQRGRDIGVNLDLTGGVVEYGGAVLSASRRVDTADYANHIRVTGHDDADVLAIERQAADIATAPEGRWDASVNDSDLIREATIIERALSELAQRSTLIPSWSVDLDPEHWSGPDDLWLGDTANLEVLSGRLDADIPVRVQSFAFEIGDDGDETLKPAFGTTRTDLMKFLRHVSTRLDNLDRR